MKNDLDYDIKSIYQQMELDLIQSMRNKLNIENHLKEEEKLGFNFPQWQAIKLKELKRFEKENKDIVNKYTSSMNDNVKKELIKQLKEGSNVELKKYKKAGNKIREKTANSFFKINDRKVKTLIKSINKDFNKANKAVLRMTKDQYRQTIFKAEMFVSNGIYTEKQAVDMAVKDFLDKGINCIEYKGGRRVNIASYAQMAVRTASHKANLIGQGEMRKSLGVDLVIVSTHGTSCDLCSQYEGQILVDDVFSGADPENYPEYDTLSSAMDGGLLHPNCRHEILSYYLELANDIANIQEMEVVKEDESITEQINYAERNKQRFLRLETGSQDSTNIKKYKDKREYWQNKVKQLKKVS